MEKRLFHCTLAVFLGMALAALLVWMGATAPAQATYVEKRGTGDAGIGRTIVSTASGASLWSPPLDVSGWFTYSNFATWLERGADGTQAVFWLELDPVTAKGSLSARMRSPAGNWSDLWSITGWVTATTLNPKYWSAGVAPDGTVWAVWTIIDDLQPGDNVRIKVGHRPPEGAWQTDDLSEWWITEPRGAELHIGPDGDMATVWVECASSSPLSQGPCMMNVRRRPAGATTWDSTDRLDGLSGMGIAWPHVLVGPAGLTVVVWAEANPLDSSQWGVMSRAYVPSSNAWESSITNVSNGWIEPRDATSEWLAYPVMDGDGTLITAWYAKTSPGSSKDAQYSATRQGANGHWNFPAKISTDRDAGACYTSWLAVRGGTTIAAWECISGTQEAIFANARDPGSVWGLEAQVSAWRDGIELRDLGMWAGGTAVALWEVQDTSRLATEDEGLFWSARHTASWGDGGQGQLGDWIDQVSSAALELGDDGSGTAFWGVIDASQPTGQQGSIQMAAWSPGGPWGTPRHIAEGYKSAFVWHLGTAVGPGGQPVAVAWQAVRDVANPATTPSYGVFYSQSPGCQIYLPVALRDHQ